MPFVKGYTMSAEHKAKIGKANSDNMKRLWATPEYRANQIARRKGVIPSKSCNSRKSSSWVD